MATVRQQLYLDFNIAHAKPIIVAQYDEDSRIYDIHFLDNGKEYAITTEDVNVKFNKPDGKIVLNTCVVNSDGTATLTFTDQMCMADGRGELQIMIVSDGEVLHTLTCNVVVRASVYSEEQIVSTNEFSALNKALEKVNGIFDEAKASADAAKISETNAKTSETNAKTSETNAKTSETNAKTSETNANTYKETAETKATEASGSANNAYNYANNARSSEVSALASKTSAEENAKLSQSYAVGTDGETRTSDATDNSKYYYLKAKEIAETGLVGALFPLGTINFEDLPALSLVSNGGMYNIKNDFVSTSEFVEGAGIKCSAGTNVYKITLDGTQYWDCLAGNFVSATDIISNNYIDDLFNDVN